MDPAGLFTIFFYSKAAQVNGHITKVYVVIRIIFFGDKCVSQKKSSSRVITFCGNSCKPVTCITAKKQQQRPDNFFTRIYRKKKLHVLTISLYTRLLQKKIHDMTIFVYRRLPQKKITRPYRKETITNFSENACM